MRIIDVLFSLVVVFVIVMLFLYLFVPFNAVYYQENKNPEFHASTKNTTIQFYPNMRYKDSNISFKIHDCSVSKKYEARMAFKIISNRSVLDFKEVDYNEDISVYCEEKDKLKEGLFVAGEGGPLEIVKSGNYNIISKGKILLLRDIDCKSPIVALHELLHALGFAHSGNPENIMYETVSCNKKIGNEIIHTINSVYSEESRPDLVFEEKSLSMEGRYLNADVSVRNVGLKEAGPSKIRLSSENKTIKEISVDSLELGEGRKINLREFIADKFFIKEIKLEILTDYEELDKQNNIVILKQKNKE